MKHYSPTLVPVMGGTQTGKSYLIDYIKKAPLPSSLEGKVAFIEVGKILRTIHPPEYFQGQMAPEHTQKEAWDLFTKGYEKALHDKAEIILVDGQPRTKQQVDDICAMDIQKHFVYMYAPLAVRQERAHTKYQQSEAADRARADANWKLALQRMNTDILQYHDFLCEIHLYRQQVVYIDTSHDKYTPERFWKEFTKLYV